jgi:hypothetical protein
MLTVTAAKNVRKFFQNNEFPPFRQDDSGERKLKVTALGPGFGHFRNSGASIFDNPGPREQFRNSNESA